MFNDNSPRANRLFRTSDGTLKMRDLYNILHDRLEYCRCELAVPLRNGSTVKGVRPLSELTDIDVLCQTFCYEVEKALGLHQEEEPAVDMGPWTGGVTPVEPKPYKISEADEREKARETLRLELNRAVKMGHNASPYLAEVLIKALHNGAI